MFRKTTITITLAAAAFVAIGSTAAPADAHAIDCWLEPFHCMIDVVTEDRDRGPVEEDTTLDTNDIIDAIGDGGLVFPVPTGPTLTPGGVSTDVSPGTVITPELPDGVLDAITGPTVELPPVELPPIEAPETAEAPAAPAASASDPATPSSERGAAVAPSHVEAPTATTPRSVAPVASEGVTRQPTSTTSVAAQDEATQEQADESGESVESLIDTDATSSLDPIFFDPMMAALFGMLGALVLMLAVFAAFAAGRRRN